MANAFDLESFKEHFSSDRRKDLVYMARTAEAAERYEDMCAFMKALVETTHETNSSLTVEERNLLSVAYKNVIGARRASFRTLNVTATETQDTESNMVVHYRKIVEKELDAVCKEVLKLLEDILIPNSEKNNDVDRHEARVFYLKMTGDYYRYLAEFVNSKEVEEKSGHYYGQALEIAEAELDATHPIRLGLALNYSVCYYEILKDKKRACDLAKSAFDKAIAKLDKLPEANYKDSTLIMQLLRDNLTLWTSSDSGETDLVPEHDDETQE